MNAASTVAISFGPHACSSLDESATREWLVTDGRGGYAMGTVAGLRTRRYHGLLVVAAANGASRRVGLAALDAVVVVGDRRIELATHEWAGGSVAPEGHLLLARFDLIDGVPRWTWNAGEAIIERELAMVHGSSTTVVVHRLVSASGPVRLELTPLCTWRDAHGDRHDGDDPHVAPTSHGFVFEDAYRVESPSVAWRAGGSWYRAAYLREEVARGLGATEDLWAAGVFEAQLAAGESVAVVASTQLDGELVDANEAICAARNRNARIVAASQPGDETDRLLAIAADQFVVGGTGVPSVVAGYPWFGAWSRDTMTSYEGLFLTTGRAEEGRALLAAAADTVSEGMLANTADTGTLEYNTADGTLWYLHALGRHVARTADLDLPATIMPAIDDIIDRHIAGTRFNIGVDAADGLLRQGENGLALTWMDARIDGVAVTARSGKAVDINALWINGLRTVVDLKQKLGMPTGDLESLDALATRSFAARFRRADGHGLYDVVDGPHGDDAAIRPNQLLALSLPHGPGGPRSIVDVCRTHLLTPIGMRSLSPADSRFAGRHRGNSAQRDAAYHQGTIWPWLLGPYRDACRAVGVGADEGSIDLHLSEWGLGSISETADGAAPFDATGCPFQAWSVAEVLRTRRRS